MTGSNNHSTTAKSGFKRILASSAWLSSYRVLRMAIAFGISIIVARYLGPEDYGKLHYALALITIFMGVVGPGMKDVITRRFDLQKAEKETIIRASFRLMLVSNALMLTVALLMVLLLRPGDQLILMMAAAIGIGNVFRAFECYELWFHFKLEMGKTVLIQSASFVAISFLKILFVLFGIEVFWFAVLMGGELLLSGIGFLLIYKFNKPSTSTNLNQTESLYPAVLSIFKESLPAIAGVAFVLLLFKSDQVMLGWLLSDEEVGYYAIAVPFSEYWAFLAIAIITSTYPAMLEAFRTGQESFDSTFRKVTGAMSWIAFLIMGCVWLLGEPVIRLLLGETYAPSADILSIHIWSLYFVFMIEVMKKWYVIHQKLNLFLVISGVAAVLNIGVNYFIIPQYGGIGAAWATILAYSFAGFWGLLLFPSTRKAAWNIIVSIGTPVKMLRERLQ